MTATGTYINEFDDWYDVYVILNEPNDDPTRTEVDRISEVVKYHVAKEYTSVENLKRALELYLSQIGLNCLDFGFQIIVRKYEAIKQNSRETR